MNELNKPETIAKLPSSKVFSEDGCLHQPSITITAKFATISYSEIESHGPAASPLGFPAPIVHCSKFIPVVCFDKNANAFSKERALLHQNQNDVETQPSVAYMLTSFKLKQTICGEIVKGVVLRHMSISESGLVRMAGDGNSNVECFESTSNNDNNVWELTNRCVAIKIDCRKTMQQLHGENNIQRNPENPWKEVAAMQLLGNSHPNVMGLIGAFTDDQCLYEVMHYCSRGTLSTYMHSHPSGIPEPRAKCLFKQILSGLFYMHSHGVCHHDISTDNVMLDGDASRCIIIDFGMCLRVPHSYPDDPTGTTDDVTDVSMGTNRRLIHSRNHCGKLRFMAPEIYNKEDQIDGLAADLWSAGVVLFVLLTGRQPYEKPNESDSGYYDLLNESYYWDVSKVDPCFSWGCEVSNGVVDLLKHMMRVDPRERATLAWVLNHKWMTKENSDDMKENEIIVQ